MKTKCLLIGLLLSSVLAFYPTGKVVSQAYEILDTPIVGIEISQVEPRPPGVSDILDYGGSGGGGGLVPPNRPHWELLPDDIYNDMRACGYAKSTLTRAALQLPSGRIVNLQTDIQGGCWWDNIEWDFGMELGNYTLSLDSEEGSLQHTWTISYPDEPTSVCFRTNSGIGRLEVLLMGFAARSTLTIHLYAMLPQGDSMYLATRHLSTDQHGAIGINVTTTRSSGFANNYLGLLVSGIDKNYSILSHCEDSLKHLHAPGLARVDYPNAVINDVWVEHNVMQDDQYGMRIHTAFTVHYFRGRKGTVNAWFSYADGDPLRDLDQAFYTEQGFVATHLEFWAPYFHTSFSDFPLFMPYSQLHMGQGHYDLMFELGIHDGPNALSDYPKRYFSYDS